MSRTVKTVEDRHEQIMDAALRVFARKGYTRASNKDIAREAGITPGLIYHYFVNKEALLKALFEDRSPLRLIRAIPSQMLELPPEELLRFLARQMLAITEDEKFMQLMCVYLPEAIYNPEAIPFGPAAIQEAIHFLGGYLAGKMESGELIPMDPGLVAHLFLGSIMDLVLRRQVLRDPATLQYTHDQIVDGIVGLTLKGLLPR